MSTYALVTLRLANGEVVGPLNVFGLGGVIGSAAGPQFVKYIIDRTIDRANEGKPFVHCLEPEPGHCFMLRAGVTEEDRRAVDLRGAVVIDVR
jgi:hypothetical protein